MAPTTIAVLLFCTVTSSSFAYEITVKNPGDLPMGSIHPVKFRVVMDYIEEETWDKELVVRLDFNLTNEASWAMEVMNTSLDFSYEEMLWSHEKSLMVKTNVIGFDVLNITSSVLESGLWKSNDVAMTLPLNVILADRTLNTLFTIIMMVMIIINTVNMGGQLDLQIIRDVFKRPVGPAVGFASQFVIMPLLSFGIGAAMFEDKLFRLGLFILGCSPGGTGSNFWTLLLNGDINLSITMTFVSTVSALGMMPLWIFLLGSWLSDDDLIIPYGQLMMTLVSLVLPISLGMWIRFRFTKGAKIMKAIIVPFTLLTVLFIFTAGIYINLFIFMLMTGKMIAAGFLVAFLGYSLGAGFSWLCGLSAPQITAVSIETAFQNGGIAFVLLKLSLPAPFGDLAAVAPVAQLMLTGLPLWVVLAVWKFYQKCIQKKPEETSEDTFEAEKLKDDKELLKRLQSSPEMEV